MKEIYQIIIVPRDAPEEYPDYVDTMSTAMLWVRKWMEANGYETTYQWKGLGTTRTMGYGAGTVWIRSMPVHSREDVRDEWEKTT